MLIFKGEKEQNDKFYEIILTNNYSIPIRWGYVGTEGTTKTILGTYFEFSERLNFKLQIGYKRETEINTKINDIFKVKMN